MKIRQWMVAVVFLGSIMCLLGGCSQDPPVYVTPFVLKPCAAPLADAEPNADLTMGTRPYEEAVAGGDSPRQ